MKTFQRNIPSIIGWIMYFVFKNALSAILLWAVSFLFVHYFPRPPQPYSYAITVYFYTLASFLGFVASAKWVVFPLTKHIRMVNELPSIKTLFITWLLFCIGVFLYGRLPLFALIAFPVPEVTKDSITFIWVTFISFLVYLYNFWDYAHDSERKSLDNNKHQSEVAA